MDPIPTPGNSFEGLLNSPLFTQALDDTLAEECDQLMEDIEKNKIPLTPGNGEPAMGQNLKRLKLYRMKPLKLFRAAPAIHKAA